MIPDGGLHCNLDSWQRYLAAHLAMDEDFLPKDIWTYIHTPITQGFYGFGWMIDNRNDETGVAVLYLVLGIVGRRQVGARGGLGVVVMVVVVVGRGGEF